LLAQPVWSFFLSALFQKRFSEIVLRHSSSDARFSENVCITRCTTDFLTRVGKGRKVMGDWIRDESIPCVRESERGRAREGDREREAIHDVSYR
jgi:hypothetical protein